MVTLRCVQVFCQVLCSVTYKYDLPSHPENNLSDLQDDFHDGRCKPNHIILASSIYVNKYDVKKKDMLNDTHRSSRLHSSRLPCPLSPCVRLAWTPVVAYATGLPMSLLPWIKATRCMRVAKQKIPIRISTMTTRASTFRFQAHGTNFRFWARSKSTLAVALVLIELFLTVMDNLLELLRIQERVEMTL